MLDTEVRRRNLLASELRAATRGGQLRLRYQPVVDLTDGRVVGAEALVRWQHPRRGLLEPGDFLDVAEDSGSILDVGRWVLVERVRSRRRGRRAPGCR